jgi:hypothetical protein
LAVVLLTRASRGALVVSAGALVLAGLFFFIGVPMGEGEAKHVSKTQPFLQ